MKKLINKKNGSICQTEHHGQRKKIPMRQLQHELASLYPLPYRESSTQGPKSFATYILLITVSRRLSYLDAGCFKKLEYFKLHTTYHNGEEKRYFLDAFYGPHADHAEYLYDCEQMDTFGVDVP